MTHVVQLTPREVFHRQLHQSVHRARMEAALDLGTRGVFPAGRIINACEAIHASYQTGALPDPKHTSAIRQAIRELQQLLAAYGASGLVPKPSDPLPDTLTQIG